MANRQDFIGWAKVARRVPLPQVDTSEIPLRSGRYGELYVQALVPSKAVLAEEGTYFTCTNPTPSTAIAYGSGGTQATFVDTVPFMQVLNTGNPGDPNAPVVYMDYLKLISNGTAPASTTHVEMAARLDAGLKKIPGVKITYPAQSNAVFAKIPKTAEEKLHERGWHFYTGVITGEESRLMCSWDTTTEDVDGFVADLREITG